MILQSLPTLSEYTANSKQVLQEGSASSERWTLDKPLLDLREGEASVEKKGTR